MNDTESGSLLHFRQCFSVRQLAFFFSFSTYNDHWIFFCLWVILSANNLKTIVTLLGKCKIDWYNKQSCKIRYSWTSLCRSGRDPEKYFDIGMVRLNQMVLWGANIFAKLSVLKRILTFKHILLPFKLISFIGEYKIKR